MFPSMLTQAPSVTSLPPHSPGLQLCLGGGGHGSAGVSCAGPGLPEPPHPSGPRLRAALEVAERRQRSQTMGQSQELKGESTPS